MGCCQSGMHQYAKDEIKYKDKSDEQTPEIFVPLPHLRNSQSNQNFSDWQREQNNPKHYNQDFKQHYQTLKQLNDNGKKTVFKVLDLRTNIKKVAKVYNRHFISRSKISKLVKKFKLAMKLKHPNVIRPLELYETDEQLAVICRYCKGLTLQDYITGRFELNEMQILRSFVNIFNAVRYCHDKKVAHMNLNPQNVMFIENIPDSGLAIINFAKSRDIQKYDSRRILEMQFRVHPPEQNNRKSLEKMDIWSLGMILFVMLVGYTNVERNPTILWDLLNQDQNYSSEVCLGFDLARKMLELDQTKRFESQQILEHQWVQSLLNYDFEVMLKSSCLKSASQATKRYIILGINSKKNLAKIKQHLEKDNTQMPTRKKLSKILQIVFIFSSIDFTPELDELFRTSETVDRETALTSINKKQWQVIDETYITSLSEIYQEAQDYKTIIHSLLNEGLRSNTTFLFSSLIKDDAQLSIEAFIQLVKENFIY